MSYPFGTHSDIPNADYHAAKEIEGLPAVSSSYAKTWHKQSPAHANADTGPKFSTAFDIGTATHSWALEGVLPIKGPDTRRGSAWQEAKAVAALRGTVALTSGDYDKVERMVEALRNNEHIAKLLDHPKRIVEASVFAKHPVGLCMKARPDLFIEKQGIVVDVKTTVSAEPYAFEKQAYNLGYAVQAAWYVKTLSLVGIEAKRFLFCNVEKEPPYATSIVEVGDDLMKHSAEIVERVLIEIQQAKETNSYATGWPAVHVATLPNWL